MKTIVYVSDIGELVPSNVALTIVKDRIRLRVHESAKTEARDRSCIFAQHPCSDRMVPVMSGITLAVRTVLDAGQFYRRHIPAR